MIQLVDETMPGEVGVVVVLEVAEVAEEDPDPQTNVPSQRNPVLKGAWGVY